MTEVSFVLFILS